LGIFLDSLGGGPYTDGKRVEGGGLPVADRRPSLRTSRQGDTRMKKKAKKEDMKKGGKKGK